MLNFHENSADLSGFKSPSSHSHCDEFSPGCEERGYTLVPLRLYWVKGRAKVELGLARGKKASDKREAIRERTDRREVDRAMASARKRQR